MLYIYIYLYTKKYIFRYDSNLEEQPPHSSTHCLSVVEYVEAIHELVDSVAALGDGTQVCH